MRTIRPMIISVIVMSLIVFLVIYFYPKHQLITGYIVYKEYSKSNGIGKQPEIISEAVVSPSEFIKEIDKPTSGISQFKIWVANKDEKAIIYTDSITWFSVKCGEKVTIERSGGLF